jgi:hypothetical protein
VKKRIMARAGAVGLLVAGSVVVPALAQPAAANNCSHAHSNLDATVGSFIGSGVNIRSGPHSPPPLTCSSNGQGQLGDGADYHCFTSGDTVSGTSTWTWVRNTRTGVQGWVHDSFLSGFGSFIAC